MMASKFTFSILHFSLHIFIPSKLISLFSEISRGESWVGRVCCPLPQSETCKRACVTATSQYDLYQGCRQSDEIAFFSCVDRQSEGENCCSHARTEDCKNICTDIFKSDATPSKNQRKLIMDYCEFSSPRVLNCIKNFTKVTPATNLQKRRSISSERILNNYIGLSILQICIAATNQIR